MKPKRGIGGLGRHFLNAGAAMALMAVLAAGANLDTLHAAETEPRQILLKADEVTYDSNARTVTARGHVEISDQDRTLLADEPRRRTRVIEQPSLISLIEEPRQFLERPGVALQDLVLRDGVTALLHAQPQLAQYCVAANREAHR